MKHTVRTLLASSCAVLLVAVLPSAAPAATSPQAYQNQVKSQANAVRGFHDRQPLVHSACMDKWADSWAAHLAKIKQLKHRATSGGNGVTLTAIMRECRLKGIGENLASGGFPHGYAVVGVGRDTVQAKPANWMQSSGHRANLLGASYNRTGIGAARASNGDIYVVQLYGALR